MGKLTEAEIDYLEEQIPHLAALATRQAYWDALMSGQTVTIAEDGVIYHVSPDGTRKAIKTIPKPRPLASKSRVFKRRTDDK